MGSLHENKNIGGGGCQLNLINKKGSNAKKRKNAIKYQSLKIFSSLVSLTRHFTIFIFLEQLTAIPQFNMHYMLFFYFSLSSHHDTNPLLHLQHFHKKNIIIYWLILTVNHQGSYFPFFVFIQ